MSDLDFMHLLFRRAAPLPELAMIQTHPSWFKSDKNHFFILSFAHNALTITCNHNAEVYNPDGHSFMGHSFRTAAINSVLITLLLLSATLNGKPSDFAVVVSPIWFGYPPAISVIAEADGAIVRDGRSDSIALGYSGDPLFTARLYRAGALFVFGSTFSGDCKPRV